MGISFSDWQRIPERSEVVCDACGLRLAIHFIDHVPEAFLTCPGKGVQLAVYEIDFQQRMDFENEN